MTHAELLDLLREARNWVGGWSGILPMAGKDIDALRARIDAALAERLDSAKDVVESDPWWSIAQQRANEGRYEMIVWRRSLSEWCWDVHVFGQRSAANGVFTTEAEDKSAAIAAANGMR